MLEKLAAIKSVQKQLETEEKEARSFIEKYVDENWPVKWAGISAQYQTKTSYIIKKWEEEELIKKYKDVDGVIKYSIDTKKLYEIADKSDLENFEMKESKSLYIREVKESDDFDF